LLIIILLTVYFLYEKAKTTPNPYKITTSGYIEGNGVRVASLNGGRLLKLDATEGQEVEAGQLIAELDAEPIILKRGELVAALAASEGQYNKLLNGPRAEEVQAAYQAYLAAESKVARLQEGYREEDIAPVRSQLEGAEAALTKARSDFERMTYLYKEQVISRSEYEGAETAVSLAESRRDALIDQIKQMETGTPKDEIAAAQHQAKSFNEQYLAVKRGARAEDIQSAAAELDRIKAGIAQVDEQINEAKVYAPVKGYIRELPPRPGDVLPPGASVASLIETGGLWVKVYIPAYRLGAVHLGQVGYIYPDALPGEKVEASITYISPQGEFTPRNIQTQQDRVLQVFEIKLTIANDDPKLKPGMGCEVVIPLDGRTG
jgi:HlyD family secretion protein